MKTIVVAVDGSKASLAGLDRAAELAKAMGARLELAYVSPPVLLPPSVYADTIKQIEEAEAAHAEKALAPAIARAAELGVPADRVHLIGAPAEAITDLSTADRVWGVVIGAKGHNAISRVLLGSVTDRLVHICQKPVLVVR